MDNIEIYSSERPTCKLLSANHLSSPWHIIFINILYKKQNCFLNTYQRISRNPNAAPYVFNTIRKTRGGRKWKKANVLINTKRCSYLARVQNQIFIFLFCTVVADDSLKDTVFIRVSSKVTAEQNGVKLHFRSIEPVQIRSGFYFSHCPWTNRSRWSSKVKRRKQGRIIQVVAWTFASSFLNTI